ncbi:ATP-binding cassette domain-containing protein [Pacificibacter sp. AS14]|uniref:iron ABC transporter ATP-binding protein n=1 Tax=Pacificibacter sp. AS14 TaxID=3135785 RepID=UPI0031789709
MISIEHVSYKIGDTPIISDVTTALPKGKVTALIGPNGAGKSSLLNIIARQATATTGTVEIDGLDVTQTDPRILAHKMAIVSQHVGVASRLRVRDLIGFGRWPHNHGRPTQIDVDKIDEALSQFDLEPLAHRFVDELSGGQRQRAFVAMGFVQDTDWVLLDEPLNNLDLRHARALMAHLKQMSAQHGKSIVIVLHDLNFAMSWADHIVALKNGQVAFSGPTRDVAHASSLSDLYNTDVQIHAQGEQFFVAHHGPL